MNPSAVRNAEFNDPRLAPLYDLLNPWGRTDDLFLALATEALTTERPAARAVDLGCGTGQFTLGLAGAGFTVTGVDPARASLELARAKPGAERVTWLEGTSSVLLDAAFDLAMMTSHVAQFLTGDAEWAVTLADLRRSLVRGGQLIFDSRDPAARGWEAWNPANSRRWLMLSDECDLATWTEVVEVAGPLVTFVHHSLFSDVPEEVLSLSTLRFRSEQELRASLSAAGFDVLHIYGGWQREPVGQGDGEFLVVARAR